MLELSRVGHTLDSSYPSSHCGSRKAQSDFPLVNPRGIGGGLALLWDEEISISILTITDNFIDTTYMDPQTLLQFRATFIYAPASYQQRLHTWDQRMVAFQEFLDECSLMDLESKGCAFTLYTAPRKFKRCFRFEAFWMEHPDCGRVIKEAWKAPSLANADLTRRIQAVSMSLTRWSRNTGSSAITRSPRRIICSKGRSLSMPCVLCARLNRKRPSTFFFSALEKHETYLSFEEIAATLWEIWKARNNRVFRQITPNPGFHRSTET